MRFFVFLILLFIPSLVQADMKRLAVLEFTGGGVDQNTLLLFSDQTRAGILEVINKDEIMVTTRESTLKILKDMGKDANCIDGSCELEIAESIGADYVVSGMVIKSDSEFVLTLKLFETSSATLLATKTTDATQVKILRKKVQHLSRRLVLEELGGTISKKQNLELSGFSGSFDDEWTIEEKEEGIIHFQSKPAGAIVLLDGKLLCQTTPCSKQVTLGAHQISMQKERFALTTKIVEVKKRKKVFFTLEPNFGYLHVKSSISGVSIVLDGQKIGKLPIKNYEVESGKHVLRIQDSCYLGKDYHFNIASGEEEKLEDFPLKPRTSGIKVSVKDGEGNAKAAKIYVDNKYIGDSPLTQKIPLCSKTLTVEVDDKKRQQKLLLKEKKVSKMDILWEEKFLKYETKKRLHNLLKPFCSKEMEIKGTEIVQCKSKFFGKKPGHQSVCLQTAQYWNRCLYKDQNKRCQGGFKTECKARFVQKSVKGLNLTELKKMNVSKLRDSHYYCVSSKHGCYLITESEIEAQRFANEFNSILSTFAQ